jgi:hypothetical protein
VMWVPVLLVMAVLGGGLHAWWDTSLSRIRTACAIARVERRAASMFAFMQTPEHKAAANRAFAAMAVMGSERRRLDHLAGGRRSVAYMSPEHRAERLHWMLTCNACGERQVAVGRGKCQQCIEGGER